MEEHDEHEKDGDDHQEDEDHNEEEVEVDVYIKSVEEVSVVEESVSE